jgi:hypothetical protein
MHTADIDVVLAKARDRLPSGMVAPYSAEISGSEAPATKLYGHVKRIAPHCRQADRRPVSVDAVVADGRDLRVHECVP